MLTIHADSAAANVLKAFLLDPDTYKVSVEERVVTRRLALTRLLRSSATRASGLSRCSLNTGCLTAGRIPSLRYCAGCTPHGVMEIAATTQEAAPNRRFSDSR